MLVGKSEDLFSLSSIGISRKFSWFGRDGGGWGWGEGGGAVEVEQNLKYLKLDALHFF